VAGNQAGLMVSHPAAVSLALAAAAMSGADEGGSLMPDCASSREGRAESRAARHGFYRSLGPLEGDL